MRIAMITPNVGDAFGQERVVRNSSALLREQGHEVYLVGGRTAGTVPSVDGVEIIPGLLDFQRGGARALKMAQTGALHYLEKLRPDVVHFIEQLAPGLMRSVCREFPTVLSAHTVSPTCPASHRLIHGMEICREKSGWKCLANNKAFGCLSGFKSDLHRAHVIHDYLQKRKALVEVSKVIAISRYVQDTLIADGWAREKVELVYNPVPIPKSVSPLTDVPRNLILCAARLVRIKGIDLLLRALKPWARLDWTLWICGEGEERESLLALTHELGLEARVSFRGAIPYAKMAELMVSSRFLVQPNVGPEGFGMSAAEACALGVPVVIFDVPALNEIIIPGQNGLVAKPKDVDSLGRCVGTLLQDDALVKRLGEGGKALMREKFSPRTHLEATLSVYTSCQRISTTAIRA